MFGRNDGVVHSQVRTQSQPNTRRYRRLNIVNGARAFNRSAHEVYASRVIKSEARTVDGKGLTRRKIVWLEKMKHRLNVFICSFRLAFHIYLDSEERAELKDSGEASKSRLSSLKANKIWRQEDSKTYGLR